MSLGSLGGPLVVTGGAGFIGSNLVRHLLAHTGARIVIVDALTYAGHLESIADLIEDPRVEFRQIDIADGAAIRPLFEQLRPSTVFNLAAETHVDRSIDSPRPFLHSNLVGTFELLEAARACWAGLAETDRAAFRVVHISTDEVYGSLGPDGTFSETTPYAPNSPYAASKAGADHLARAWFHTFGLPVIITNCSNNYGPYQYPEKLVPLMILNALEGKALPVYGDGGNVRDWLFVEDHCEGLQKVAEGGRPGEKYNIGGNNERTNLQMLDALCDALEALAPSASNPRLRARGIARYRDLVTFVPDRPGHDRRYAIDAGKIRRELGWQPRHDIVAGVGAAVAWYVGNLAWCEAVTDGRYDRGRLGLEIEPRTANSE
jgi:dTDP-glucose 4,6-dehydratase